MGSLPIYRLHDHTGDDLGRLEHLAPNVQPGDVVVLEALVNGRVESQPGAPIAALLEVVIAPTYHPADDALP